MQPRCARMHACHERNLFMASDEEPAVQLVDLHPLRFTQTKRTRVRVILLISLEAKSHQVRLPFDWNKHLRNGV